MENMKHNLLKYFWSRLMLLSLFVVCGTVTASAHLRSDSYPYKTTVKVATGAGSVYVVYNDVDNYNYGSATTTQKSYEATVSSYSNTTSITLNATPAEGYRFLRWEDGAGNVISATSTSPTTSLEYNTDGASRSTNGFIIYGYNYSTVREFSFNAFFKEEGDVVVKVADGQEAIGSAVIREESFEEGDEITLVASTINGSELTGWSFDHWELNGVNVSEKSEYKVTVPDSKVTYVAYFSRVDTENYCFIRNKTTGKYLRLSGTNNYTAPSSEGQPASFNGSFTLVDADKAVSDPGCVFIITGTSNNGGLKNATIISQNKAVGNLSGAVIIKKALTIRPVSDGTYTISTIHTRNSDDITMYFRDNNGTPDMINSTSGYNTEWELLQLNSANLETNYFGAAPNAAITKDGKYFTTLYTTFPYQLQSGKAFYANHESIKVLGEGENERYRVECIEVPNGIVPANAPVILVCDGTDAATNKLLPLPLATAISPLSDNLLRGHISVVNGSELGDGSKYVLSIGKANGVGLYKLKIGTAMPDNKAYVYLDEEAQQGAKKVVYVYGDDDTEPTGLMEVVIPEDNDDAPVYDLLGRRVCNPAKGIYIKNGKKFIKH